jgi:hypothetical protein
MASQGILWCLAHCISCSVLQLSLQARQNTAAVHPLVRRRNETCDGIIAHVLESYHCISHLSSRSLQHLFCTADEKFKQLQKELAICEQARQTAEHAAQSLANRETLRKRETENQNGIPPPPRTVYFFGQN